MQELQAIAMMLCRMAFNLSCKVVALHLDNSTAKAYLCNQGGTVSPFLSRLACQILSVTDKHGIALIPAYIPTHLNVGADYLSRDHLHPEWHLLSQVVQAAFCLLGLPEVDLLASSHSTQCEHYFTLKTPPGGLGVECLQPSLDLSGKLCVSSCGSSPSNSVQVYGRTCQWSTQTFDSGDTLLDGGSLASHSSQHVSRHSLVVSHHKKSHHGFLVCHLLKGLPYLHLTLWWFSDVCYVDRDSLPWSVRWWRAQLKHLCQRSTSSVGRNGPVGVLNRVYQTMPYLLLN